MTGDRKTVVVATAVAVIMIAQQVAAKAARDAFFLTHFPATSLPVVMAASAAISFAAVLGIAHAMARIAPGRVAPLTFGVSALLFAFEWWASQFAPSKVAVLIYLHVSALGGAVVSGFWSVMAERFDSHRAKRAIAPIAGGATLGGVLGGLAAWQGAQYVDITTLLLGLAALNMAAAVGLAVIARGMPALALAQGKPTSGYQVIREVPYLQHLGLLMILGALGEAAIDYVFKAEAARTYDSGAELVTFFAIFHMVVSLVTLGIQSLLTPSALRSLGLAGAVATLPAAAVSGGLMALLTPRLWSIVVMRGATSILENSLFRSAYELLYTPLTPSKKRPTKTVIDVGCDRLGALAGSGIALVLVSVVPAQASKLLLLVAVAAGLAAIVITSLLHAGYVGSLADSLRSGAVHLESESVLDATTQHTLADTVWGQRSEDLTRLRQDPREKRESQQHTASLGPREKHDEPPLLRTVAVLWGDDDAAIKRALRNHRPLPDVLVGSVIPLLARNAVARAAGESLVEVGPRIIGQLVDILADSTADPVVRRRIPSILARIGDERAVEGLFDVLGDEHFDVRYRAAMALLRMTDGRPMPELDTGAIMAHAIREAQLGALPRAATVDDVGVEDAEPLAAAPTERLGRRLTLVFALLSLVMEREPLMLAYRALTSPNEALRGTGLEYLENVLPPEIHHALRPYFGRSRPRPSRARETIMGELIHALEDQGVDVRSASKSLPAQDDTASGTRRDA